MHVPAFRALFVGGGSLVACESGLAAMVSARMEDKVRFAVASYASDYI